eukprot:gene18377-24846_t
MWSFLSTVCIALSFTLFWRSPSRGREPDQELPLSQKDRPSVCLCDRPTRRPTLASPCASALGTRVSLHGLNTKHLNGAVGEITDLDPDTGRWGVRLLIPRALVREYPNGVRVRPENLSTNFDKPETQGLVREEMRRIIPNYCPYTFGDKKQMDVAMKQAKDELSAEIVAALMDGTLPQWFAKKITYLNNDALQPGGALSHNYGPNSYLAEL